MRQLAIADGSLIRFVRNGDDLPGQHLLAWLDEAGEAHPVSSSDDNDSIREAMGQDFTAKHFRTWGARVLAFDALASAGQDISLNTIVEPGPQTPGNKPDKYRRGSSREEGGQKR